MTACLASVKVKKVVHFAEDFEGKHKMKWTEAPCLTVATSLSTLAWEKAPLTVMGLTSV